MSYPHETIAFESRSSLLNVIKDEEWFFPLRPPTLCDVPPKIETAFDAKPVECLKADDYIVVFEHETDLPATNPDLECLKKLDIRGVVITTYGKTMKYLQGKIEL